ncbi:MAG: toll/interleukin-1 receptor domain-containing protein [Actinomycetota bacterium]|nr:toll/interleukin-1 receptor domain-containing protein [Actinomycetota bacterium]
MNASDATTNDDTAAGATRRRAFVSHAGSADIRQLSRILWEEGYEPFTILDLPDSAPLGAVVDAIQSADLVIVVVSEASAAPDAAFELGLAVAAGKRPLVITDAEVQLPSVVAELAVIRAAMDSSKAIRGAIRAMGELPSRAERQTSPKTTLGPKADELIRSWEASDRSPQEAGSLVLEALRASGVRAVGEPGSPDAGFDFAIWEEALGPSLGIPLLVEVISDPLTPKLLELKLRQLVAVLEATPAARWGLVVYGPAVPVSVLAAFRDSPILLVSARDLFEGLRRQTFADLVRGLRNQRVHS